MSTPQTSAPGRKGRRSSDVGECGSPIRQFVDALEVAGQWWSVRDGHVVADCACWCGRLLRARPIGAERVLVTCDAGCALEDITDRMGFDAVPGYAWTINDLIAAYQLLARERQHAA